MKSETFGLPPSGKPVGRLNILMSILPVSRRSADLPSLVQDLPCYSLKIACSSISSSLLRTNQFPVRKSREFAVNLRKSHINSWRGTLD
jgi:hypothetical protein